MAAAISFIELGQEVARVFEACGKDDRLARCALDRVNSAVSVAPALSEVDVSSSKAFQGFTTELANLKTYADKWQRKTYIKKLYGAQKYAQQFDETFRTLDGYTNELNLLVAAKGALNAKRNLEGQHIQRESFKEVVMVCDEMLKNIKGIHLGKAQNYRKIDTNGKILEEDNSQEAWLGNGSFGRTFRMRNTTIEQNVADDGIRAVKTIELQVAQQDNITTEDLLKEIEVMALLTHEHIVSYCGHLFCGTPTVPQSKAWLWIVMEYIDGDTLFKHIPKDVPATTILTWAEQLAEAFEYMHKKNVLHRDVKSQNIMVSRDGKSVCVIDLGLAKCIDAQASKTHRFGRGVGAPAYASREKFEGSDYGPADDMWGVGCVLAELGARRALQGALWSNDRLRRELISVTQKLDQLLGKAVHHLLHMDQERRILASQLRVLLSDLGERNVEWDVTSNIVSVEESSQYIPPELWDCIRDGLIKDPIIASDGCTYDKTSLLEYEEYCRDTGRPLSSPIKIDTTLNSCSESETNEDIKRNLERFLQEKKDCDITTETSMEQLSKFIKAIG